MKIIGITGGVGCGKSALLKHIMFSCKCRVILADEVGHSVKMPGQPCFDRLVELLGEQVLDEKGEINRSKMADLIFRDESLRLQVNSIIHPAVKAYIESAIIRERELDEQDFIFIEAALLIEDGYISLVDELWYVYADEQLRRERLRTARNYSDEKIDAIMKGQLSEKEFREFCPVIIDNNGSLEGAYQQIEEKLGEYLCQK